MNLVSSQAILQRPVVLLPAAALLLAAAAGVIWADLAARADHAVPAPVRAAPPPSLLVATRDVAPGTVLTARDVVRIMGRAPLSALRRADEAEGHMALTALKAGAPILAANVSADLATGLAPHVPPGLRAYAVPVTESQIAGGFLQAGDRVDIYVTLPGVLFAAARRNGDLSRSTLLLQDVAVLAVGTRRRADGKADTGARTVTLAIPPGDLARLALANRLGTLGFAIRNPLDHDDVAARLAEVDALTGKRVAQKPAARHTITFYSGRERRAIPVP